MLLHIFHFKLVARWSWKIWRDKSNLWTFYDFYGSGNRFIVYFMKRNDVPSYPHAYVDFFNKLLLLLALLLDVHIRHTCIFGCLRYIIQNFRYMTEKMCWINSFRRFISWTTFWKFPKVFVRRMHRITIGPNFRLKWKDNTSLLKEEIVTKKLA